MSWAWVAIVFGVLIILSRAPLILSPDRTLTVWRRMTRSMTATNTRVRLLGPLYIAFGAVCIPGSMAPNTGIAVLFQALALVCFGAALWTLFAPSGFRRTVEQFIEFLQESVDTAALRWLGVFAVGIGALIVYLGVQAL